MGKGPAICDATNVSIGEQGERLQREQRGDGIHDAAEGERLLVRACHPGCGVHAASHHRELVLIEQQLVVAPQRHLQQCLHLHI